MLRNHSVQREHNLLNVSSYLGTARRGTSSRFIKVKITFETENIKLLSILPLDNSIFETIIFKMLMLLCYCIGVGHFQNDRFISKVTNTWVELYLTYTQMLKPWIKVSFTESKYCSQY